MDRFRGVLRRVGGWLALGVALGVVGLLVGGPALAGAPGHLVAGQDPAAPTVMVPPGVSNIQLPLTPSELATVPGLAMGTGALPPQAPAGFLAAHRGISQAGGLHGGAPALTGPDYQWCSANGDTPPLAIVSLP